MLCMKNKRLHVLSHFRFQELVFSEITVFYLKKK
jgi:hypothetical protein